MSSPRARSSGFTLIEMMVALSIFASLMAVLMFGYSQGLSLWERATRHTSFWQSLEHRHSLLARLFMQIQQASYTRVDGIFVSYFKGAPRQVQFVSRAPLFDLPGRVRVVELSIEQQVNNQLALVYREAHRSSDPARGINWDSKAAVPILENLRNARFRFEAPIFPMPTELDEYFLTDKDKQRYRDSTEWVDSFDADWMWRVPQRVQMDFIDARGMEQQWTFGLATESDAWTLGVYADD